MARISGQGTCVRNAASMLEAPSPWTGTGRAAAILPRPRSKAADRRSAGEGPRARNAAPMLEASPPWTGPGRGSGHIASPAQRRGRGEAAGAGAGREGPEVPAGLRGRRPAVGGRGSVRAHGTPSSIPEASSPLPDPWPRQRPYRLARGAGEAADRRSAGEGPFADPALDHIAIRAKKNRLATISGTKMI
jgi:hypothetical protein